MLARIGAGVNCVDCVDCVEMSSGNNTNIIIIATIISDIMVTPSIIVVDCRGIVHKTDYVSRYAY